MTGQVVLASAGRVEGGVAFSAEALPVEPVRRRKKAAAASE